MVGICIHILCHISNIKLLYYVKIRFLFYFLAVYWGQDDKKREKWLRTSTESSKCKLLCQNVATIYSNLYLFNNVCNFVLSIKNSVIRDINIINLTSILQE